MKYIYPIFLSQHIAVHDLSPLALWYWCNMHTQLLSFKIRCLSQNFRPQYFKSTAASWNVTSSYLFSSFFAIPHGQLCMRIAPFQARNFPGWRSCYPCTHYWNYFQTSTVLKYTKLILFIRIVVWHMRVSTRLFEVKTHF